MRKLGDTITYDFTTHDQTGSIADADEAPTCDVFEGDNDTPILSPEPVKRSGLTGHYRVCVEATTGNGFEVGKSYNVVVTAILTIKAKARIACFTLEAKRMGDLNDLAQSDILSDVTPFGGSDVAVIKAKTNLIPADIGDVPTAAELNAAHGSGKYDKVGGGGGGFLPVGVDSVWSKEDKLLALKTLKETLGLVKKILEALPDGGLKDIGREVVRMTGVVTGAIAMIEGNAADVKKLGKTLAGEKKDINSIAAQVEGMGKDAEDIKRLVAAMLPDGRLEELAHE